jgi:hypothetical protein
LTKERALKMANDLKGTEIQKSPSQMTCDHYQAATNLAQIFEPKIFLKFLIRRKQQFKT